jgi:hypothetical protein
VVQDPEDAFCPDMPRSALEYVAMDHRVRLAEAAERWPVGDPRWGQLARPQGDGLLFYAEGCCVRLEAQPERRRLVVREMGRVLVRLPCSGDGPATLPTDREALKVS